MVVINSHLNIHQDVKGIELRKREYVVYCFFNTVDLKIEGKCFQNLKREPQTPCYARLSYRGVYRGRKTV